MSQSLIEPIHPHILPNPAPDSDNLIDQPLFPPSPTKRAPFKKIKFVAITIFILSSLLLALYFLNRPHQKATPNDPTSSGPHTLIVNKAMMEIINMQDLHWTQTNSFLTITELILVDPSLKEFNTSAFHNLKKLIVGSNVKLDSLVISNSQMTEFIYNSSELKYLTLVNNTKMESFINCTLPALLTLNVTQTPVLNWVNNRLGKLAQVEFRRSYILKLPNLDVGIQNLTIIDCGTLEIPANFNDYFANAERIEIINSKFIQDTNFASMKKLASLSFVNNTVLNNLIISDCNLLEELTIEGFGLFNATVQNLPRLYYFFPRVQQIEWLTVVNTSISEFIIETEFLDILYLQGPNIRRIQPNITHLTTLYLVDSLINETEFSQIQLPAVHRLVLTNCSNLKRLNNTFPSLHTIQINNMQGLNFSSLNLPQTQSFKSTFCNFTTFDTKQFVNLSYVIIANATISKLILNNPISTMVLTSVPHAPQIIFNSSTLTMLEVEHSQSLTIKNNNLSRIQFLCTTQIQNLTIVNNTFSNFFKSLSIMSVNGSITFQNNTFDFNNQENSTILIDYINKFGQIKENFHGATDIHFDGNNIINLTKVLPKIPDAKTLCIAENNFTSFSNITNDNLTLLILDSSNHLTEFAHNNLTKLNQLELENCANFTVFRNNSMPLLTKLNLKRSGKLKNEDLLAELTALKNQGTKLGYLALANRDQAFEEKVAQLFPGITIE